ncbi:type II toxin-antitoxin system YhaV family toxin [Parendozoicomonas sp. Alg238-R29]|uniref:type II toxin-antitoxin system YhaV family toxin n=1 Tax=Parendozoicomonas sp. Alg238-R29 TaxID=2993446 RepID=UPI00248E1CD6|nr:type II toxin-antitoxin system YhaV family toxin [Parendozoicomonas sp. Alg238-R29]
MEVVSQNGWDLLAIDLFLERLESLTQEVEKIYRKHPTKVTKHHKYKLLMAVSSAIFEEVPANPDDSRFRQGNTLGPDNKSWRRVKKGLPTRYRLFFQFRSAHRPKSIVYAWLNDESTIRKAGAKTDVYEAFKKLLEQGQVPKTWDELAGAAQPLPKDADEEAS